jgi:hypothetical protein
MCSSRDFHDAYPVVAVQRWPWTAYPSSGPTTLPITPVLQVDVPASAQPGSGIGRPASLVAGEGRSGIRTGAMSAPSISRPGTDGAPKEDAVRRALNLRRADPSGCLNAG